MDGSWVGSNRHNSTTVNGVVINIAAGGQHQVNNSATVASSATAKPSRRVRRDASFRLPAFLGGSKRSINGSSSPGSSRRAPSPSSLSSASSSSSPAFVPSNNNNNNHAAKANLDVHNHPESVRAMKHAEYSSSSSSTSSGSNVDLISNSVNLKIPSDQMSETYKSLGDVFGINAAVASIAGSTGNVRKASKNSALSQQPQQQQQQQHHLKSSRSVSNVLAHHEPTYQTQRLSTYANVPASNGNGNGRFGTSDTRASYNERLSVSRQPTQQPQQQQHQHQPQRQYSINNNNPFPTIGNGTPRRQSGVMGPPPPPTSRSIVYKSNTSLDLDHDVAHSSEIILPSVQQDYQQLRREYGSQGSINTSGNRFVAAPPMNAGSNLGYRDRIYSGPIVEIGQASPGPAASSTLQRKSVGHCNGSSSTAFLSTRELNKSEESTLGSVISNGSVNHGETGSESSPKTTKKKIGGASSGFFSKERESNKSQKSLFKKFRGSKENNPDPAVLFGKEGEGSIDRQAVLDDCHRRRFFLHHDIGSMCARMTGAANQVTER